MYLLHIPKYNLSSPAYFADISDKNLFIWLTGDNVKFLLTYRWSHAKLCTFIYMYIRVHVLHEYKVRERKVWSKFPGIFAQSTNQSTD